MANNMLSDLQLRLLKMLKWFHAFCVENGLHYYVLGGTMLGAARHQGFIPWDDDVDVGLPRGDYEKLKLLLWDRKKDDYVLETPYSEAKEFCYAYSKLYDTQTTLIENKRYPVKRGVFIDIFPLDGLGNKEKQGRVHHKKIIHRYRLYSAWTCNVRKGREPYKNAAVILFKLIPPFVIRARNMRRKLDCLCSCYDFENSVWGVI